MTGAIETGVEWQDIYEHEAHAVQARHHRFLITLFVVVALASGQSPIYCALFLGAIWVASAMFIGRILKRLATPIMQRVLSYIEERCVDIFD